MKGKKSHEIVEQALTILVNLDHRGACCEENTGDGAGILIQMPHLFLKKAAAAAGFTCRSPGSMAVATLYTSPDPAARAQSQQIFEKVVREEGQSGSRLARPADRQFGPRQDREGQRAVHAAGLHPAGRRFGGRRGFRAEALRHPQASRTPRSARPRWITFWYAPSLSVPDAGLQRHAHAGAGRAVFPRPARPGHGDRAGAGAFALLDEHLPELGALAPVSLHRAQRRDQHAARQHQLDARAPVAASRASCSATTSRRSCRSSTRTAPTRRCSTTCSNCSSSAGARCRTR